MSIEGKSVPTRVITLSNQPLISQAMRVQLEEHHDFKLVAEGHTNADLCPLVEQHEPDVVLLSLMMASPPTPTNLLVGAFELLREVAQLRRSHPQSRVILLAPHVDRPLCEAAFSAKVNGYLLKHDPQTTNLPQAIRLVQQGGLAVSPEIAHFMQAPLSREELTAREHDVLLSLINWPRCNHVERASHLGISEHTLKKHLHAIYEKLEVENSMAAVVVALQRGMIYCGGGAAGINAAPLH